MDSRLGQLSKAELLGVVRKFLRYRIIAKLRLVIQSGIGIAIALGQNRITVDVVILQICPQD